MRKRYLFATLMALMTNASAQLYEGVTTMAQDHHSWRSSILADQDSTIIRTNSFSKEGVAMIALDYTPPSCTVQLWFVLDIGNAADADNYRGDITLSFRADTGQRFDLPGRSSVTMGDTMGSVTLDTTEHFPALMTELRRGKSLRTKIKFGDDEAGALYMTYSLMGFTAAQTRAFDLCMKPTTRRGPQSRPNYIDRL